MLRSSTNPLQNFNHPVHFPVSESNSGSQAAAEHAAALEEFMNDMPCLVCMAHQRWDFVYQRPQHLLSRFARHTRLYYFEEPIFHDHAEAFLDSSSRGENITVLVPHLPHDLSPKQTLDTQVALIDAFFAAEKIDRFMLWYYNAMALEITRHLKPELTVFDCMEEHAADRSAPPRLRELEDELFGKAQVVFTGGQSLYEAKKAEHPQVFAFPSSIDKAHFDRARRLLPEPEDQKNIPFPRLGFFGVIDERFDGELLRELAEARPDWHFVMIGPIMKIDPEALPQHENIHYLGAKKYAELPNYLASWDVALLTFANNEATRLISPAKIPEYLAAGKPVVSSPIKDVVRPYGENGLVHIARNAREFEEAIGNALAQKEDAAWLHRVDTYLANTSWDQTWYNMALQMQAARAAEKANAPKTSTT